jgi:hypothetical protein
MAMMSKEWMEKKEFDVITTVEDSITNLVLLGMKRKSALSLLVTQAAIRMDNAADVREVLRSIESGLVDDDDDDEVA